MALGQAARTIRDYLHNEDEQAETQLYPLHHQVRSSSHTPFLLLSQQLHDLTVASSSSSPESPPPSTHERAASPPPWTFSYKESRGVQAEAALALLLLWVTLIRRSRRGFLSPDEQALLCLTMDCLASLIRGNQMFQHLILRLWHEKSDAVRSPIPGVPLQTFCLEAFVDWKRRGPAKGAENGAHTTTPVSPFQLASLLGLWDLLAARQPLGVQAEDYTLMAECLLHPVYTAASTPAPLSPTRRRDQTVAAAAPTVMTMSRGEKMKTKKGGGRRRSTCTRRKEDSPRLVPGASWDEDQELAGEEEEEEEEGEEEAAADEIPANLTMDTSDYKDEEEVVDPNLLLLPSLHLLAHAARGSPSFRLFLKALDHQEDHLLFDALLSLVVSAQTQPSTTPLMALATLGDLSRLVAGDANFESRVFDRKNVRETTKLIFPCLLLKEGGREERVRAAVDLWGDLLASPLVLGLLEEEEGWEEGEGLSWFLVEGVVALGDSNEGGGGGEGGRVESLLRALRVVCEQSPLGQSLLIQSLLPLEDEEDEEEGEEGGRRVQKSFHLTKLVQLALSTHIPTAVEAVALLQQLLVGASDENSAQLWAALTVVLTSTKTTTTGSSSSSSSSKANSTSSSSAWAPPSRVGPSSATVQLSRSPLRRRRQQATAAAAATAAAGAHAFGPSLLELLVNRLQLLADEVEVSCGGSGSEGLEIGARSLNAAAFLELEWSLRPVLSLLCWVMTSAPSSSFSSVTSDLRRGVGLCLDSRAVSVIVLGVAHVRCQVWKEELGELTSVMSMKNPFLTGNSFFRMTLLEEAPFGVGSLCAVERLEVVVRGCRLLVLLGNACSGGGAAGAEEEEGEAERISRVLSNARVQHRHWLSIVLDSSQVVDILAAALHQGINRELLSQTLFFLADLKTINTSHQQQQQHDEGEGEEGPEWSGLIDGLFRRNQAMQGCLQVLEKEMTDLANENGIMIIELQEQNVFVEEAEGQRAALQAAHDQEMERVGQDWREEVLKLRMVAKAKESENHARMEALISDQEGWQARAEAAEAELALVQETQQATAVEAAVLRKEVETLTAQLTQREKECVAHEARAAALALEVEEHQQRANDASKQKEKAEEAVRKSNAQVDKALAKMTVFSKAFKAKDEAARVGKARLRKLDVHVGEVEKELVILRGRLAEAEGENRRLQALLEAEVAHREREVQAGEEEMERVLEDVEALRALVEVKTEAMRELEYVHQQVLDELQEKNGLLMDQEEVLRRQQHAAALIKRLAAAVEEEEEGWEEGEEDSVYN